MTMEWEDMAEREENMFWNQGADLNKKSRKIKICLNYWSDS